MNRDRIWKNVVTFDGVSFIDKILSDKVATQFSLCHFLTLYVLHDQMIIICYIIK